MKTWFTSDTHVGHLNMTQEGKDLCGRGFKDVPTMNAALLDGINSTVPSDGRLVMLGDNIMGNWDEGLAWAAQIECAEVVWLPGNHDKWSRTNDKRLKSPTPAQAEERAAKNWASRLRFAEELAAVRAGFKVFMEDDDWEFSRSWDFCLLSDEWQDNPLNRAQFSHYPHEGESFEGRPDRYTDLRPTAPSIPVVCGHVHTSWAERGNQFNAGVDVRGFKPVSEDEIANWMESLDA